MNAAVIDKLLKDRCALEDKLYKELLGNSPAVAASSDVFQDALENLKKSSATLTGWRNLLRQHSTVISKVISSKLGEMTTGQAPKISPEEIDGALRKGAAISFEPAMLNDFAGYSQGPGPMGNVIYKTWDEVSEQGAWRLQKATQSSTGFVQPAQFSGSDADYQLNAYSRESGLVAFHTASFTVKGVKTKQNLLFNFYPLGSSRILWIGQEVDENLLPKSGSAFTVALNWRGKIEGQMAFFLTLFAIAVDPKGAASPAGGARTAQFVADSPRFDELRSRIAYFKKSLLEHWRNEFRVASTKTSLGVAIADAFQAEQKDLTRQPFSAAPLFGEELQSAFKDPNGRFNFQLHDLNQFAGEWKATFHVYPPGGAPAMHIPQFLTWLEFTLGEDGFYQRVVGAASKVENPLRLSGEETGLINIVLDAYLPECGLVSWLRGYGNPDPTKAEAAVIAYKLAADRTLWVAQFFDQKTVETAMKATKKKDQKLPESDIFNLTLEWIIPGGGRKYRYLISKFFKIDFAAGSVTAVNKEDIVKVESSTV